jgi:hypothetical protein
VRRSQTAADLEDSGPAESVALRGLFGCSESLEGQQALYGLVPDGSLFVRLNLLDGRSPRVRVVQNVYIIS